MMRKNYYLTFGVIATNIYDILDKFSDLCDIEFELHESSYLGKYYLLKDGLLADRISIKTNNGIYFENQLMRDKEKFGDYSLIIDISMNSGKNKDKDVKYKHLKSNLKKWGLHLLSDEVLMKELNV